MTKFSQKIVSTNCQRCGKKLTMASKSLFGQNNLKKDFGILCYSCVSEEEKFQLNKKQKEFWLQLIKGECGLER